jgi:octaprenyl-diphosphate synthase
MSISNPSVDADRGFLDQFNPYFDKIDEAIRENYGSPVSLIEDISEYSLLGNGKRLRPLLFVLTSRLCGYRGKDLYQLATIFEYIHTASLLHDDVLDDAETRRRRPSAKQVWGNLAAVLGGDFLYLRAVSMAIDFGNVAVLRVLSEATAQMVEGQFTELVHTHNWHIEKEEYLNIITSKTGALISATCAGGAVIADADEETVERLKRFGLNLGIAFQLIDDVLDYTGSEDVVGKPVGKDLREGKITLPLIYALSDLGKAEREGFAELFKTHQANEEDYETLIKRVRNNGVVDTIRVEASSYVDRAVSFLDPFPGSPSKDNLQALSRYICERAF